ncbi:MAG: hypothetical protein HUU46_08025 [Candidatus Hydrogenedentes bacterium]|nr:hypothetical protein [Candidatus Hydrogenedentota bacterium]
MTSVDRKYLQLLDENPGLASEQCRGFLIAVWDNLAVRVQREHPELGGRRLALAVARRLYASDLCTQALLDKVNLDDAR